MTKHLLLLTSALTVGCSPDAASESKVQSSTQSPAASTLALPATLALAGPTTAAEAPPAVAPSPLLADTPTDTAAPAAPAPAATTGAGAFQPKVLSVEVPFAYARQVSAQTQEGGVGKATIRVLDYSSYEDKIPDKDKHVGIAVMEEYLNGTGELWQTSAWIASFVATSTLNRNLLNYEMMVKVPGFVDGPSAGMLTTVSIMALINGAPLLPGRCITGAVNLDGSMGPVGGLLAKLEGCSRNGITHLGIPVGSQSEQTGDGDKNVIEVARNNHQISAVALSNVHEAYQFMTGQTLTKEAEIEEADLELTQNIKEQFQGIVQASYGRLKDQFSLLGARTSALTVESDFIRANTKAGKSAQGASLLQQTMLEKFANGQKAVNFLLTESEKARKDGNYTLAYNRTLLAQRQLEMLTGNVVVENHRVLLPLTEEALLEQLAALESKLGSRRSALTDHLKPLSRQIETAMARNSLGAQMDAVLCSFYLAEAHAAFDAGYIFHQRLAGGLKLGKLTGEGEEDTEGVSFEFLLQAYEQANLAYARARVNADTVTDWMKCVMIADNKSIPSQRKDIQGTIEQLSRIYSAGSSAVLGAYDAVINQRAGGRSGQDIAGDPSAVGNALARLEAHSAQAAADPMINVFRQASSRSAWVNPRAIEVSPEHDSLLRCASGAIALLGGTRLVAEHYYIGSRTDDAGNMELQSRGALTSILENARSEVRRKAGRLKKAISSVPESVRLDYQLAKVLQYEKNDRDRLQALFFYWRAGQMCSISELCARAASRR